MFNKKLSYSCIITKTNDKSKEKYLVYLPDFKGYTEGTSFSNALFMAKDYVKTTGIDRLKDHQKLPHASKLNCQLKPNQKVFNFSVKI